MPSDPYTTLREALERIAAGPRPGGRWTASAAQKIAREALDAASEPEWEYRVEDWLSPNLIATHRRRVGEWECVPDAE